MGRVFKRSLSVVLRPKIVFMYVLFCSIQFSKTLGENYKAIYQSHMKPWLDKSKYRVNYSTDIESYQVDILPCALFHAAYNYQGAPQPEETPQLHGGPQSQEAPQPQGVLVFLCCLAFPGFRVDLLFPFFPSYHPFREGPGDQYFHADREGLVDLEDLHLMKLMYDFSNLI